MASMVLIPGAWLGGWVWTDVARDLRASGHEVFPITLTGLGDRAHLARPETDMMTHLRDVIAAIEMEELMDVVLVGHSYGSAVAGGVASEVPERIARTVFIDMAPIENGQSVFDSYPPGAREIIEEQVEELGGGWRIPVISDDEVDLYFGEHGLSEKQRGWFRAHAVGQPVETFRQPLRMKDAEAADRLPRTYVRCTGTPVPVPIESAPNWDCLEISAGHWPMITRPRELSHVLNQVAALPAPA